MVKSAGINPVDWKVMGGFIPARPHVAPYIPGWDLAGVVEAVGEEVTDIAVGDEVYSYHRPEFDVDPADAIAANGCLAEYVSVPVHRLARKPAKASWSVAAGIPLAGLTAYQGLHRHLKAAAGSSVLITGGSGGVGGLAVQLAKAAGCSPVIATCSAKNVAYVASLGADWVVDYGAGDVAGQVRARYPGGVDLVSSTRSGATRHSRGSVRSRTADRSRRRRTKRSTSRQRRRARAAPLTWSRRAARTSTRSPRSSTPGGSSRRRRLSRASSRPSRRTRRASAAARSASSSSTCSRRAARA